MCQMSNDDAKVMNGADGDASSKFGLNLSGTTHHSRRKFLHGAAALGIAGVGMSTSAVASNGTAYDDEYEHVVNIVDAGADNTGSASISPILEAERRDHTLFYFPPGEYYMDSQFRFTKFERFGVIGEDATLIPANYYDFDGPRFRLFRLGTKDRPSGHVRFEGFDVDQTAPDTGIRVIDTYATDRLEVRDVTIRGEHDSGTWGPGHFNIADPDGTGIVDRFRAPDGGAWVENTPHEGNSWRGPIGIEANQNRGSLTFKNCELGAFPDNGLYAAGSKGTITVDGGTFRNSNGANIRIGGPESVVQNVTVNIDHTREQDRSQRGIRLENGRDMLVRNVEVINSSPLPTSRAISVMNSCKGVRIEDSSIQLSGNDVIHGIVASPHSGEILVEFSEIIHETSGGYPVWIRGRDNPNPVHLRAVEISGEAGDAAGFRDSIRCVRDGCRFSYCELSQRGRNGVNRNGLVIKGSDTTVYQGTLRAERFPYVDQGADNLLRNAHVESYRDNVEAVRLYSGVENPVFRVNVLVNGIQDLGATGVTTWRNTIK